MYSIGIILLRDTAKFWNLQLKHTDFVQALFCCRLTGVTLSVRHLDQAAKTWWFNSAETLKMLLVVRHNLHDLWSSLMFWFRSFRYLTEVTQWGAISPWVEQSLPGHVLTHPLSLTLSCNASVWPVEGAVPYAEALSPLSATAGSHTCFPHVFFCKRRKWAWLSNFVVLFFSLNPVSLPVSLSLKKPLSQRQPSSWTLLTFPFSPLSFCLSMLWLLTQVFIILWLLEAKVKWRNITCSQ